MTRLARMRVRRSGLCGKVEPEIGGEAGCRGGEDRLEPRSVVHALLAKPWAISNVARRAAGDEYGAAEGQAARQPERLGWIGLRERRCCSDAWQGI